MEKGRYCLSSGRYNGSEVPAPRSTARFILEAPKDEAKYAYNHITLTVKARAEACGSVTFQGGYVTANVGAAGAKLSFDLGYANKTALNRSDMNASIQAAYFGGAHVSVGVDEHFRPDWDDWEVGPTLGFGIRGGAMEQLWKLIPILPWD